MTRKNTISAYLHGELNNELNERGITKQLAVSLRNTREDIMRQIDTMRKKELYKHTEEDCSFLCKKKGTNQL